MQHWQCKLVFIDIAMPTEIPLVSGEFPGFRFLGLFPLSCSLPFPVIMTSVLDLQVCLDNQRLIGGISTKRNSHARGKQLLYRYIHGRYDKS